jgi:hypothetical protein
MGFVPGKTEFCLACAGLVRRQDLGMCFLHMLAMGWYLLLCSPLR